MNKEIEKAIKQHEQMMDDIGMSGYKIGNGWNSIKQALEDKDNKLNAISEELYCDKPMSVRLANCKIILEGNKND